jgi:3-methyladenine DNA glycosylase AlkD
MGKANARLDAARKGYREALEVARKSPTPEAWSRLLAAGKELSAAEDRPRSRRGRRAVPRPTELAETIDTPGEPIEGLD